ncbi:hypothetical protein NitYY0826_C1807 [Nitratiruptor sp. YY08-26]|uniref:tRNA (5-methylaminomethyl-2-thiouridine)(34)-methyltransferase MnmD n=1 Tax=unclassified Nitratiruptor TaxID=2624044 RepID=UPI001916B097|nr:MULTISPECIES: MnmC family methyltransferase [unclassified Nitratiruptor]BCD62919.1 hypothetical protein NitYY0813_C1805 [Nitratiruptor sp. YY08-13]BCD66854.1 hypothetical protein NitYY0826_C1807 [Nitratiruptor sp. YY08-26]
MKYEPRLSADGTITLYSKEYDECYHSLQDGALTEALFKHVKPAFSLVQKPHFRILDICFGLGINTLTTIDYFLHGSHNIQSIEIFSPELDSQLLEQLKDFSYPKPLKHYREILLQLIENKVYKSKNIRVELYIGDARAYVKNLHDIDIVYQDAFSPKKNPLLWTVEYFSDIAKLLSEEGVVTTYSIATPVRLAMFEVGLNIYELEREGIKKITIASKKELPLKKIDMEMKKKRSTAKPLRDDMFEKI